MIKQFIIRILLFSLILTFVLVSLTAFVNTRVKNKAKFKLNSNIEYLFLGHSHSECAFNDSIIKNSRNFSESGESYFYTLPKLKQLLNQNKQVEVVFLEFTNNQVNKNIDNWIWKDDFVAEKLRIYHPFIGFDDKKILLINNFIGYQNALLIALKANYNKVIAGEYNFTKQIGAYKYLVRDKMDSLLKVKMPSKVINSPFKKSVYNLRYLRQIIDFCKSKNVKLYLVRSPQHKFQKSRKNEYHFQMILKKDFKEVSFLDFNDYPINDTEYADFGHLNYKGAAKFSKWFNTALNKVEGDKNIEKIVLELNKEVKTPKQLK